MRGFPVKRERGWHGGGKQNIDGPPRLRVQGGYLSDYGRNLGQKRLHVWQIGHVGAQDFRIIIKIADDNAAASDPGRTYVAHKPFGHVLADAGQQRFQQVGLNLGMRQFGQHLISHGRGQFVGQALQGAFLGFVVHPVIQAAQNLHNAVLKSHIGFQAQVIHRRLQEQHLLAARLGGLRIFHKNVAVGDNVRIRHLPGHIDSGHHFKIGPGQKRQGKKSNDEGRQPPTAVMPRPQCMNESQEASWPCRLFLRYHKRLQWLPPKDGAQRQLC